MFKKKKKQNTQNEDFKDIHMENSSAKSTEIEPDKKEEQTESRYSKTASVKELKDELDRVNRKSRFIHMICSTAGMLTVTAAAAVLAAFLWVPVLQVYGNSMSPTLEEGQIIVSVKGTGFEKGDLIAFYLGNKILVKRYIAGPGQWVDMDENGTVYVDGQRLEESYVTELSRGTTDLEYPYQVPESRYFVLGDHRETSLDSRSTLVGCVSEEQIVGKIVYRIWPFDSVAAFD